jgi:hypothetical protein
MEEIKQDEAQTSKNEQEELKAPVSSEQENYESVLQEKDSKISKLQSDLENYRKGMLKYKGMVREQEEPTSNFETFSQDEIDNRIEEKVKEVLLSSQIAQAVEEKNELIKKMARELSETKIALKNKPTSTSTASGTNQDKPEVRVDYFTPEQLAELKKKGVDPNKVLENMRKGK